ncbi:MAG: hypothetical protein RBU37_11560 [Myxococcota bacterium]|jgi:hypothetical protein|nr:hypothetical protein [Myxococcota bacterium]
MPTRPHAETALYATVALLFAALLAVPHSASAQDGCAVKSLGLDAPLLIGQRHELVFELDCPKGARVEAPGAQALYSSRIQVLSQSLEAADDGKLRLSYELVLFHLGKFYFPALELSLHTSDDQVSSFMTPVVELELRSLLADSPGEHKLREATQSFEVMEPDLRYAYGAAIAAFASLLLIGGVLLWRRRRAAIAAQPAPQVPLGPPWELALERLNTLPLHQHLEPLQQREAYFELSEIVREYLGRRFAFDALELTTRELLETLQQQALPRGFDQRNVDILLLDCDLVKFARYRAQLDEQQRALAAALKIIEQSKPTPQSKPSDGAELRDAA